MKDERWNQKLFNLLNNSIDKFLIRFGIPKIEGIA